MKNATILLLSFLTVTTCFGQTYQQANGGPYCVEIGLRTLTTGQTLQQNAAIILEGSRSSQDIVTGLNKKYPVYLKSGTTKIKLNVLELLVGQVYVKQVVLRPEEKLEIGREYELNIDSLPKGWMAFENNTTPKWTIIPQSDNIRPQWLTLPKLISKRSFQPQCAASYLYPCSDFEQIDFEFAIADSSHFTFKVTIENIKTNNKTTFYVNPNGNRIVIGHDECYGAFKFGKDNNYEATFDILDASGNLTTWEGRKIKFDTDKMNED